MPTKVVRAARTKQTTLGSRGRNSAPRSLVDEAIARVRINAYNRLKPLAQNLDTFVQAPIADVIETYSTKHVS